VTGLPRLSVERLFAIDPDAIFLLTEPGRPADEYLAPWRALTPLRAVASGHVAVVETPEGLVQGPLVLHLVDELAVQVKKLEAAR
jgi:ABC-type Fe3+-hydroxamate transport system substrate-binding protein